jgi:D-glycero-D-manno-heptose 1,7-bisphosphate phosphatase
MVQDIYCKDVRMLIILDRDGVINEESIHFVKSPKEWIPIAQSLHAIARLNQAGHQVVIATNQSGVGRGHYSLATLETIHQKMRDELSLIGGRVDGIYFCPHHPEAGCACRKPQPGMLRDIIKDFKPTIEEVYMVGDSLRDMQAGQAVAAKVVLVRTGNGEKTLKESQAEIAGIPVYADLANVVDAIIQGSLS